MATSNKETHIPTRKRSSRTPYSPIEWHKYFSKKVNVEISQDKFNVYMIGDEGPLLLLLHGGGYSGLTWSLFASKISNLITCQIMAIDFRGHGETSTNDDYNLSAETLSLDIKNIVNKYYNDNPPPLAIVGHSMGGAIAIHALSKGCFPSCKALVVIDVVEGSALDALSSMQSFLRTRPSAFKSIEDAIEWAYRSCQTLNLESARVSMPGQLRIVDHEKDGGAFSLSNLTSSKYCIKQDVIVEEEEEEEESNFANNQSFSKISNNEEKTEPDMLYKWRIDLTKTECYWEGWFKNLTTLFLSCTVPKLLLLAGVDRLDKEMTIAQMQGKFQMQVLAKTGHAIHEDDPEQVAKVVSTFLIRHKIAQQGQNSVN